MKILMYIWQLPQFVLGVMYFTLLEAFRKQPMIDEISADVDIIRYSGLGGVCLGPYIFVGDQASGSTIKHEYGHYLQSRMLGPLYLIVIGLPSATFWLLKRAGLFKNVAYRSVPWEAWADKLGKVI